RTVGRAHPPVRRAAPGGGAALLRGLLGVGHRRDAPDASRDRALPSPAGVGGTEEGAGGMSRLTDRLERGLGEIAARAHPSPSAWESIVARLGEDEAPEVALLPAPSPGGARGRPWIPAAAAAAAVFVVIAGAIAVLTRVGDDHSTAPTDQSPTTTFESPRHGYSVDYPDGEVSVTPATGLWDPGNADEVKDGTDVVEPAAVAVFTGASLEDPGEFPTDDWASIDDYIDDLVSPVGCGVPRS